MLVNVPLEQIDDNPFQRRQDYGDVEALAQDIQKRGLLQIPRGRLLFDGRPVDRGRLLATLDVTNGYPYGESFRVQLAFGHRRLRAYRHLESLGRHAFATLPVYLEALTDDAMLDAVWSENQHRSDINAIEQAELLAEKLERARAAGGNQTTVAAEWNLDRSTIANKIRLLELPDEVQTALRERRLSERQALALLPVLELEQKLDGAAVDWAERPNSWNPLAPATYVAQVVKNPDQATSDAIRGYTKSAADHAGKQLPPALAAFDAGSGPHIVQSTCKGCPHRFNQHCLYRPCYDARAKRFLAILPEWASRETGLSYSEEATHFDHRHDEWKSIQADWQAGLDGRPEAHDTLVVTVRGGYFPWRPYTKDYVSPDDILADWKSAIVIGRRSHTAAESDTQSADSPAPLRPSEAEIKRWKALAAKGDRERVKRTQQALLREIAPLAENEPAMRALLAMLDPSWLKEADEAHRTPSTHEFADHLLEQVWKRAQTWHYGGTNRAVMRKLLHRAAISPDIVDPPERALRLLDIGQEALLRYEETRNHVGTDALYKRLALVRDALAEFDAAQSAVAGNDELQQLAAYLRAAEEREQKILAKFAAENATSGDPVETEQPASVEVSS